MNNGDILKSTSKNNSERERETEKQHYENLQHLAPLDYFFKTYFCYPLCLKVPKDRFVERLSCDGVISPKIMKALLSLELQNRLSRARKTTHRRAALWLIASQILSIGYRTTLESRPTRRSFQSNLRQPKCQEEEDYDDERRACTCN